MPRHGLFWIGIHPPRSEPPVGRIEDSRIERQRRTEGLRTADVPLKDLYAPVEAVQRGTPSCHHHQLLLDLDPEDPSATVTADKDHGEDPAPRTQIDQIVPLTEVGKISEEKGVEGKAITGFSLNDPQTTPENLIDCLVGFL
jgi:hypothetical protein